MRKTLAWLRRRWQLLSWLALAAVAATFLLMATPALLGTVSNEALIPAGFWISVAFIVLYTFMARWWHNPMGRMLVGLDFAFAVITGESTLINEFHVSIDTTYGLRLLVLALLLAPIVMASRLLLLGRLHRWKLELPWRHKQNEEA